MTAHRGRRYVFAYGSLMNPRSLLTTLPGCPVAACIPAYCLGYRRGFGVAFPNDGSEPDKAYFDVRGARPEFVLFADMTLDAASRANGICIPVDALGLARLQARERRYELRDVSRAIQPYPGFDLAGEVLAFTGSPRYTAPKDVRRGVVAADYAATIADGARHWDGAAPGFFADYLATTEVVISSRIVRLARVDP